MKKAMLSAAGACVCLIAVSCSSHQATDANESASASPPQGAETAQAIVETQSLDCSAQIGAPGTPGDDLTVVAGAVALPTASTSGALQARKSPTATKRYPLFAKRGLVVKTGQPFDLIVPTGQRDDFALMWGNTSPTWHLRVSCTNTAATWLAFPGGYLASEAGCVSLIVRTDKHHQRVRIGVGATCKGE